MEQHGLVKFHCNFANGSIAPAHKLIRATLRPASLTEWYTIRCVMEELERVARANSGAKLMVDFHRVGHVSVEMLPELLWLKNSLERCGGALQLCGLGSYLRDLLRLTGSGGEFHFGHGRATLGGSGKSED